MNLGDRTIRDFGEQWTRFSEPATGWYGSVESLQDIASPLFDLGRVNGATVLDLGAGTGRFTRILLDLGAKLVIAVEPSKAMEALRANTRHIADRVDYQESRADQLDLASVADIAIAIGVLHHIPNPDEAVGSLYRALKPGGVFLAWVYGREGNEAYLRFTLPLRRCASIMPSWLRIGLAGAVLPFADLYMMLCAGFRLPLRDFMRGVQARLSWRQRLLNVYDQLNPAFAKYYTRDEAMALLTRNGFHNVRCHHRRGYSWAVLGERSA